MYQKQQDILSQRHGNTGSWLLSEPVFQQWVKSQGSRRTLWCPGDRKFSLVLLKEICLPSEAGTGKTVMTYVEIYSRLPMQQLSADFNHSSGLPSTHFTTQHKAYYGAVFVLIFFPCLPESEFGPWHSISARVSRY